MNNLKNILLKTVNDRIKSTIKEICLKEVEDITKKNHKKIVNLINKEFQHLTTRNFETNTSYTYILFKNKLSDENFKYFFYKKTKDTSTSKKGIVCVEGQFLC